MWKMWDCVEGSLNAENFLKQEHCLFLLVKVFQETVPSGLIGFLQELLCKCTGKLDLAVFIVSALFFIMFFQNNLTVVLCLLLSLAL